MSPFKTVPRSWQTIEKVPGDWEFGIAELETAARQLLTAYGYLDEKITERQIRYYAQEGVFSPRERRGKEIVYTVRHLKELIATRLLLNQGWKLEKIAELLSKEEDIEFLTLGYPSKKNTAVEKYKSIKGRRPVKQKTSDNLNTISRRAEKAFSRHAAENISLKTALTRLGTDKGKPEAKQMTSISITEWCRLNIETEKLRGLSSETADDIASAIYAALTDPQNRKE